MSELRNVPFELSDNDRKTVTDGLQAWLTDLIDVALRLKQAHWNLRGPRFLSIHEHFDVILEDVRESVDDVAERSVTLGAPVDGLSATVAKASRLEDFPASAIAVPEAISLICRDLATVVNRGRECVESFGKLDPISEDLAIGIVNTLEKHHWMLDSQREDS